jgi:hypothetical protein
MRTISNERALAHWRTLCMLRADQLDLLEERFTQEQPIIAQAIGGLTGAVDCSDECWEHPERDPRLAQFDQLLVAGSCLAELFRREAGHALRPLGEAEVNSILHAHFEEVEALLKSPADGPDIFSTCDQPDLLRGIVVGHLSVQGLAEREGSAVLIYRFLIQALHRACGDAPADPAGDWDAERILVALSTQGDLLRHAALNAAETFRAQLTPRLIEELERWTVEPEAALKQDGSLGTHGLFLLAKWREHAAWPVCRKLFSLSDGFSDDLLGDLITEDGPILLAMIGGRHPDELQEMIEDETLDVYCRNACIDALTCLVTWGQLPREQHVGYLRELLTTKLPPRPESDYVFAGAIAAACDLGAWDLRPEVEAAYERGQVDEGFIDLEYFLEAAAKHRKPLQTFCESNQPITDVAQATNWLDDPPPDEPSWDEMPPEGNERVVAESAHPYIAPPKTGRNDPCPCGSGKKYKKCCGK